MVLFFLGPFLESTCLPTCFLSIIVGLGFMLSLGFLGLRVYIGFRV